MLNDPVALRTRRAPRRVRSPGERLAKALLALSGGHGQVCKHREEPWASITFAGTRHRVTLGYAGPAAIAGGEHLIAELSEHEFAIPGQLVADASVTAAEHAMLPEPRLTVECELLLLEES